MDKIIQRSCRYCGIEELEAADQQESERNILLEQRIAELEAREPLCRCADEVRCDYLKRIAELEAKNMDAAVAHGKQLERIAELEQQVCDQCSPDDYGWNYNAEEGRVPCVCIIESEAYAELEAENRIFRSTESVDDSVWDALLEQVRVLQVKLDRVRGLPEKWRDDECRHGEYYAGELEAALNKAPKAA